MASAQYEELRKKYEQFLLALALKGSDLRKWKEIGRTASRFESEEIKGRMPLAWTSWYPLATCDKSEFKNLVKGGHLRKNLTGKTIKQLIPRKNKPRPSAKAKRNVTIIIEDQDDGRMRTLLTRLAALEREFNFKIKLSANLAALNLAA